MSPNIFNLPDFEAATAPEETPHLLRDSLLALLKTAATGYERDTLIHSGSIGIGRSAINWRLVDPNTLLQSKTPTAGERSARMLVTNNDEEVARLIYETKGYVPRVVTNAPGEEAGHAGELATIVDASVHLYAHHKNGTTTATYSSLWGGWNFMSEDIWAGIELDNHQPLPKEYKRLRRSAARLSTLIGHFAQRN